jgi:hypothetical protein
MELSVKGLFLNESPVPFRPTTSPYPTSWFSRTPSTVAISLIRTSDPEGSGKERPEISARALCETPNPSDRAASMISADFRSM